MSVWGSLEMYQRRNKEGTPQTLSTKQASTAGMPIWSWENMEDNKGQYGNRFFASWSTSNRKALPLPTFGFHSQNILATLAEHLAQWWKPVCKWNEQVYAAWSIHLQRWRTVAKCNNTSTPLLARNFQNELAHGWSCKFKPWEGRAYCIPTCVISGKPFGQSLNNQHLAAWAPRSSKLLICCASNLHQTRRCYNLDGQA